MSNLQNLKECVDQTNKCDNIFGSENCVDQTNKCDNIFGSENCVDLEKSLFSEIPLCVTEKSICSDKATILEDIFGFGKSVATGLNKMSTLEDIFGSDTVQNIASENITLGSHKIDILESNIFNKTAPCAENPATTENIFESEEPTEFDKMASEDITLGSDKIDILESNILGETVPDIKKSDEPAEFDKVAPNDILETAPDIEKNTLAPSKETVKFEVVFFVRYTVVPRPSIEDITALFNNYGTVHHVNCPKNKHYAFVFITSLNTTLEHRRTHIVINQIINDMPPGSYFHITVAKQYTNYRNKIRSYNKYKQRRPYSWRANIKKI